jgi:anaerobic sulfite reductase subunit B
LQEFPPYRMRIGQSERLSDEACEHSVVRLTLEPEFGQTLKPFATGQFLRVGIPAVRQPGAAYFSIANAPEEATHYELVVKQAGGIATYLCEQAQGTELEVEGPMGRGFDLSPFVGLDVYLIGVGTGIAPLRSVWQSLIHRREDYGKVAIYAGFLSPMHRLLTDELDALAEHDIDVSVTVDTADDNWDGPIGYVQDALTHDHPDGANAVACLAGMSAMVDACRKTLQNHGFDESRILLNF